MTNNHQIIDDKELQTFFDSPLIDRDCSNINRCKAVLSKIKNLVSFNQNIDYKIKNFILIDNIISSLLSHTIANVSDPNIPIGIIEYSESVETGEDFNYKILPCSEIMSIIEHHVKEDTNGRIIRIHTRHGNLLVPSFNRADTEQHIEKKKEHLREKLREKLKRKEIRLEMFLNACNLFLTNDKSKLSILDKSEKIDSEIVTWTTNFVSKIIYPKKYPDFFMCRKRKQTATKQTSDTHIIKILKTNEENLVDTDKSKGINANEENLVDVDKNKGINANDVSKMIQSIHSSSDNAIAIEKPATQSAILHEKNLLTSVESIDTSNNQIDSHQSSYNILPSTDIEGKVKLSRNERRKLARIRLFNMKNEDKTPAETPDPGGHNLHLQVKPSHEHMSRNHLSTTGEIQKMPSNSMNYYLESGDKVYKERLCINLPENALMQHDDKFSRHQIALVEGDHYACWFDSQHVNSKFCYLKLHFNPDISSNCQHIPYRPVKSDQQAPSDIIRIPFETSSVDFVKQKIDFVNAMKGTNIKNTPPFPTNLLPPWNSNYENLFIMKAGKSVPIPATAGHMLTRVEIWKYAQEATNKCVFRLRTPSPRSKEVSPSVYM